nr:MFS transporter [Bradyrhizobium sp.]
MARLLVGTGESAVYPISSAVIGRWIKTDRRGSAQGMLHGCGRLGAALAPTVVTALILLCSWRLGVHRSARLKPRPVVHARTNRERPSD